MARVLLVLLAGIPLVAIGFGAGMWWVGRQIDRAAAPRSARELDFAERMATLRHHTDLLERARQASLADEPGLANIYSEAAERVLKLIESDGPEGV